MTYNRVPRNRSLYRTDVQIGQMPASPERERVKMLYGLFQQITWAREVSFMWGLLGLAPCIGAMVYAGIDSCTISVECGLSEFWFDLIAFGSFAAFIVIGLGVYHFHYRTVEIDAKEKIKRTMQQHPDWEAALSTLAEMDSSVDSWASTIFPTKEKR